MPPNLTPPLYSGKGTKYRVNSRLPMLQIVIYSLEIYSVYISSFAAQDYSTIQLISAIIHID